MIKKILIGWVIIVCFVASIPLTIIRKAWQMAGLNCQWLENKCEEK